MGVRLFALACVLICVRLFASACVFICVPVLASACVFICVPVLAYACVFIYVRVFCISVRVCGTINVNVVCLSSTIRHLMSVLVGI